MEFIGRVLQLIKNKGVTKNKLLTDLGLSKNSFVAWEGRGTIPSGEVISKIANYFDVSTDYLLKGEDAPMDKSSKLNIPKELEGIFVAAHGGEGEWTQENLDKLAEYARFIRSQGN